MQILEPDSTVGAAAPTVITIGKFDGVHLGHRALLDTARRLAKDAGCSWGVVTFDRHPVEILRPDAAPAYLTPLPRKLSLLEEAGANFCILLRLDSGVLSWTADDFVERVVCRAAGAGAVVTGEDFQYGRGRSGSVRTLADAGKRRGFEVEVVPPVTVHGLRVSSYAIRQALEQGDLPRAEAMLGRHYAVEGTVQTGRRLGRVLGYPTANLKVDARTALPDQGIYAVTAGWDGQVRDAVASLGVRPTLEDGTGELLLEVYVLDWEGDLYGKSLEVAFIRRLRAEERFASLDALKEQIGRDVEAARAVLANKTD